MKLVKGTYAKIISLALVALFMLSSNLAYAQIFTDVPDSHWAREDIEKMYRAGIISGNGDATFRPNDEVTKVQAIVMISRMLDLSDNEISQARQKYQEFLDEVGVESWYQDGVAAALALGIVSEDVVENTFYQNNNATLAKKAEVCVYLTRAMGLEEEAQNKTIIYLPFTDKEMIPIQVQPYIEVMIDKEVINRKGDSQGRFNPNSTVTRAIMAKMLSVAYDYIEGNDVSLDIQDEEEFTGDTYKVEGKITGLIKAVNEIYITIEDEDGDKTAYIVNSNSEIILDNEDADMEDLAEGLNVEADVTDDYKVMYIKADSTVEEYSGKLKSLITAGTPMLTIEYEEDDDTEKKAFYVSDDVDITLDGEEVRLNKLDEGDLIDIRIKNNRVVDIDAESKDKNIEGIIKEIKFNPEPVLVVEDEDDEIHEYPIDEDVDIERNGDDVELTELRVGDEVEVDIEYNVIVDIEADVVESEDEGTIKSILIADRPELTIINEDDEEVTYYIADEASIEVGDEDSDIYGLRLNYYVELEIESNYVVSIDAEIREYNPNIQGKVEYVHEDAEIIVISRTDSNANKNELLTVVTTRDTIYYDEDGSRGRFRNIDKGDEVIVIGSFNNEIFTAKSIIITRDNY